MTAKRYRKLLRAVFTEYHIAHGFPNIGEAYRVCSRASLRKEAVGANYQTAYEAVKNALR